MRSAKRTTWAVLMGVVGIGLLAVITAVGFAFFGEPRQVNPGAELSRMMNKVDPSVIRVGAVGTGAPPVPSTPPPERRSIANPSDEAAFVTASNPPPRPQAENENPTIIVLAALPEASASTTTTAPTATAAGDTTAPTTAPTDGATAPSPAASADVDPLSPTTDSDETNGSDDAESEAIAEPPPGAALGVTYCGAMTCVVGYKCCCDSCVPFEQACDPRSCEAHAGLSISVPCGMDLCDPGEVCCDARCGVCARAGECSEQPCN